PPRTPLTSSVSSHFARVLLFCFFFQAEDGIRDRNVTGVQTCALPIYLPHPRLVGMSPAEANGGRSSPAPQALPVLGVIVAAVLLGSAGLFVILAGATAPTAAFLRCWIAVA